jgi:hypothetical protein
MHLEWYTKESYTSKWNGTMDITKCKHAYRMIHNGVIYKQMKQYNGKHKHVACTWNDTQRSHIQANKMVQRKAQMSSMQNDTQWAHIQANKMVQWKTQTCSKDLEWYTMERTYKQMKWHNRKHKCLACIWNDTQWSHMQANEMVQWKAQTANLHREWYTMESYTSTQKSTMESTKCKQVHGIIYNGKNILANEMTQ